MNVTLGRRVVETKGKEIERVMRSEGQEDVDEMLSSRPNGVVTKETERVRIRGVGKGGVWDVEIDGR